MKQQISIINRIGATLVLALGASVVLNSLHAKEAVALAKSPVDPASVKAAVADDSSFKKLAGELHNHVDKHSFKSMTKTFAETGYAADPRSNRQQHQPEKDELAEFIDWLKRMLHSALLFDR